MVRETARLRLRRLSGGDAEFICELLQEPAFLLYIGDKGIRTVDDARRYIADGPVASYSRFGFGLYAVETKDAGAPVGMCGLLKRESLDDPDLGFAFLERFWSNGYALESAAEVMDHARRDCGLRRVLAITAPDNRSSLRLLGKLGFRFERMIRMPGSDAETRLFSNES